jgi:gamma-glutamyltranspeptidase / glutathione hydrolase
VLFRSVAESGVTMTNRGLETIMTQMRKLRAFPEIGRIFLKDGNPVPVGDVLKYPDYAHSLRLIAKGGPDVFYRGEIAKAIISEIESHGGILTAGDLAGYRPSERVPISGTYHGYNILTSPPPSSGGIHVLEILNMLEDFDLASMGHNSAKHLHLLAEVQKRIFADRDEYLGDPAFIDVPVKGLTSKAYARARVQEVDWNAATPPADIRFGLPRAHEGSSTTHLSVIDKDLNMVSVTQTIECYFGSGVVVPGYGFILNDQMHDLDPRPGRANSIAPGKKPLSSMSPSLVFKDGKLAMSIGSPGSKRIITCVSQVMSNMIDFGMSIQDAIAAARVHFEWDQLHVEGRVPVSESDALVRMGHDVARHKEYDAFFGGSHGVMFDREQGVFRGGADPRRDGVALGLNSDR